MPKKIFSEWMLEPGAQNGVWLNLKIYRKPSGKTRKIKTRSGGFATIARERNSFSLAWNGSRFADGKELEDLQEKFPEVYFQVLKFLEKIQ